MTPHPASKLILALDTRNRAESAAPAVKRYRIARLNLAAPPAPPDQRFDYLKRTFD
jgi:hypothetical protein